MDLMCANTPIDLSIPRVMGILNVTPDSFSDGGRYVGIDAAIAHAELMVEQGACFIDIGGESTRPGAAAVSLEEETRRVIPIIESLSQRNLDAVISVDTSKPQLMQRAVEAGAGLINDVNALRAVDALETVARLKVPVCLMHMQGEPRTMQKNPQYRDVVDDINKELQARVDSCVQAGINKNNIILDPGFGFGKTLTHNTELFSQLDEFVALDYPLLVGVSRKRMIGEILESCDVTKRLSGSVAAAVLAGVKGAGIVRVHDVAPTVESLKVVSALV